MVACRVLAPWLCFDRWWWNGGIKQQDEIRPDLSNNRTEFDRNTVVRCMYGIVHDVGDAAFAELFGSRFPTTIDFGSSSKGRMAVDKSVAFVKPKQFLLTHFHNDHYNGLTWAQQNGYHLEYFRKLRQVYSPRVPDVGPVSRRKIFAAFEILNHMVVPDIGQTGKPLVLDLLNRIKCVSGVSPAHKCVSSGDSIPIGSARAEVIWPPLKVNGTANRVQKAIDSLEQELNQEGMRYYRYLLEVLEQDQSLQSKNSEAIHLEEYDDGDIDPEVNDHQLFTPFANDAINEANRQLKGVANDLCLVFHIGDRLLWLGDASRSALPHIVKILQKNKLTNFKFVYAAHHGTYWHNALSNISANYVLVSNGPGRARTFKTGYNRMAKKQCLCTSNTGSIPFCF